MSKQYIKQIEEANESLRNALEWESKMREIERKRRERWYGVMCYKIGSKEMAAVLSDKEYEHLLYTKDKNYDVPTLEAARAVIMSTLYMNNRDSTIGRGVFWRISRSIQYDEKYDIKEDTPWTIISRGGWISNCKHYPAWGGSFIKHYNYSISVGVTESHFDSYYDYATWVLQKESEK